MRKRNIKNQYNELQTKSENTFKTLKSEIREKDKK